MAPIKNLLKSLTMPMTCYMTLVLSTLIQIDGHAILSICRQLDRLIDRQNYCMLIKYNLFNLLLCFFYIYIKHTDFAGRLACSSVCI